MAFKNNFDNWNDITESYSKGKVMYTKHSEHYFALRIFTSVT